MIPGIDPEEYKYNLPADRIARYPRSGRDSSNLLVYDRGRIFNQPFHRLSSLLAPDLLMVFNDTRVVQARLGFEKPTGSKIEILCLEPCEPSDYQQAFQTQGSCLWKCFVGNAKKWKGITLVKKLTSGSGWMEASLAGRDRDAFLVKFKWNPPELSFGSLLETEGITPIPPYLDRQADASDRSRYQTVYARVDGSVAAPTAGLHFTDAVLQQISEKGISRIHFTLHVGAGTFQPLGRDGLEKHPMHAERIHAERGAVEKLLESGGRNLAVGTTSVRTLESLYWLGCKKHSSRQLSTGEHSKNQLLYLDQWEAYSLKPLSRKESLSCLLEAIRASGSEHLEAVTRLMIVPGYTFRMTDALITNFHLPGSTLLLLVGAFIGKDWKKVYQYAMDRDFRFLSYGDSSILFPEQEQNRKT